MEFDLLYMQHASKTSEHSACDLVRDLKLDILLDAMAERDGDVREACHTVLSRPLSSVDAILKRNEVVRDATAHRELFEELLAIAKAALAGAKRHAELLNPRYDRVIPNERKIAAQGETAKLHIDCLRSLRALLERYGGALESSGMRALCVAAADALPESYLARIAECVRALGALESAGGVAISGHLGEGLKHADVVLSGLGGAQKRGRRASKSSGVSIPLSSVTLIRNADQIAQSALAPVCAVLAHFNRAAGRLFEKLRFQIGFYAGCARLHARLRALGAPLCYPLFQPDGGQYEASNLMDVCLALKEGALPVGNDVRLGEKRLVLITGPNQGGKTTFLRGVGLAQAMAQCGMFVAAERLACPLFNGVFTHFPDAEDAQLKMGLLEVELSKLSAVIDALKPGAMLLMNETFQTTTPHDAKRLASEITLALREAGIVVFFVTHLYDYAAELYRKGDRDTLFLLAQRDPDGGNTYRLREGAPHKSAYGMGLFNRIIG